MLTNEQINEIKEHLDKAQNPVFFFDNDVDGLSAFLIFQRYLGRGKGIAIKSFPGLSKNYLRRVEELNADYVFVLDKAIIDEDFVEGVMGKNIPLVSIDHHDVPQQLDENYYNTFHASGKNEPTAYLAYKITNRKEDLWLAVVGCIGDGFIPEFLDDFKEQFPEMVGYSYTEAYDVLYRTEIGKVALIFDYALKDTTSNVVKMLKYLMKAKNAYDVLEENAKTKSFLDRYNLIDKKIKVIIEKAGQNIDKELGLLFFTYGGDMSLSQHVANELFYKYPSLIIVVGYNNGNMINFSLRSVLDARQLTLDSIKDLEGATGGGHKNSTGAKISASDLETFKENIIKNSKKLEGRRSIRNEGTRDS